MKKFLANCGYTVAGVLLAAGVLAPGKPSEPTPVVSPVSIVSEDEIRSYKSQKIAIADAFQPVVATVVSESYGSSGYVLFCKRDDGSLFGLEVTGAGEKLSGLESVIGPGSRISFPRGNWNRLPDGFSESGIVRILIDGFYEEQSGETYFREGVNFGVKPVEKVSILSALLDAENDK